MSPGELLVLGWAVGLYWEEIVGCEGGKALVAQRSCGRPLPEVSKARCRMVLMATWCGMG